MSRPKREIEAGKAAAFSPENERLLRDLLLNEFKGAGAEELADLARCGIAELADRARLMRAERESADRAAEISRKEDWERSLKKEKEEKERQHQKTAGLCARDLGLPKEDLLKIEPAELRAVFNKTRNPELVKFLKRFGFTALFLTGVTGVLCLLVNPSFIVSAVFLGFGSKQALSDFYRANKQNRIALAEAKALLAALPPPEETKSLPSPSL